MGTNYFFKEDCCPTCGHSSQLHIGKSSGGWPFNVHVIPEKGIWSWNDWMSFFAKTKGKIFDEYGDEISVDELNKWVVFKRKHKNEKHVVIAYEEEHTWLREDKETGDRLSQGEFS